MTTASLNMPAEGASKHWKCWTLFVILLLVGCGESAEKLIQSAKNNIESKDFKTAAIQARNVVKSNESNKDARYLLGIALTELGDVASAEKELRMALELGYDNDAGTLALAQTVYRSVRYDDLLDEFNATQLSFPLATAKLKILVGKAALHRGKFEMANAAYEDALKLVPGFVPARIGLAQMSVQKREFDVANQQIKEILAQSPKEQDALIVLAEIARANGKTDEMRSILRTVIQHYPNSVGEHYALAVSLLESNALGEVERIAQALESIGPKDPRTLHLNALLAYQKGDYVAANTFANKAVRLAPSFVAAHLVAGASAMHIKTYEQAVESLDVVANEQRQNVYARQLLATALMAVGNRARAYGVIKEALDLAPDDPSVLTLAGEASVAGAHFEEAAKYFERAHRVSRDSSTANRLGRLRVNMGQVDEGLRVLEEASKSDTSGASTDLMLATYHLGQKSPQKALPWIERIEKKQSNAALGPSLRGLAYVALRNVSGAREQFELALKRDPAFVMALEALAQLDVQEKNADMAKRRFEIVLERSPKNESVAIAYSQLLAGLHEKLDVITAPLQKVIKNDPAALQTRFALIEFLLGANDTKRALMAAQEAAAEEGANKSRVLPILGRAQRAAGDDNQAVITYGLYAIQQPDRVEPLLLLADAQVAAGETRHAIVSLYMALKIKPDWLPALQALTMAQLRNKENDAALRTAQRMRRKYPAIYLGYDLEASVYGALGQWPEATASLEEGMKVQPAPVLLTKLHTIYLSTGKSGEAEKLIADWLRKHPKDVEVLGYLGDTALKQEDFPEAVTRYKAALALQPKNWRFLNNLAWAAEQAKDPKAQSYAQEALAIQPNAPEVLDTLGGMLLRKGDVNKGIELLQRAVALAPQMLDVRFNLARAFLQAGRKSEARKELEFLATKGDQFPMQTEVDSLLSQL